MEWVPAGVRFAPGIFSFLFGGLSLVLPIAGQRELTEIKVADIPFGDGALRIAQNGTNQGPLVLMIHGTPDRWMNSEVFLNNEQLTSRALVVSMDRLGWGGSQSGGDVVTDLRQQARAAAAVLKHFGDRRPATLVGHSLGGTIVVQAVLDHPALIDGALIVSASLDPAVEKTTWYQAIGRWKIVRWALSQKLIAADQEIEALPDQLRVMSAGWPAVSTPLIVLQGEKDKLVPIAHAEYPSSLAPTALLDTIRLPKQGHFVPWEQPQVMVDAIVRLLDHATTNAGH